MFQIREKADCDDLEDSDDEDEVLAAVLGGESEPDDSANPSAAPRQMNHIWDKPSEQKDIPVVEREFVDASQLSSAKATATATSFSNSPSVTTPSLPMIGQNRPFSSSPSMRQVTRKRQASTNMDGEFSMQEFMKFSMMQRELDRQEREKERREEREKRADDSRAFNQMMLCFMARSGNGSSNSTNEDMNNFSSL